MSMDQVCAKILIISDKVGLLMAQERKWHINVIALVIRKTT